MNRDSSAPKLSEVCRLFSKQVIGKERSDTLIEWIEPGGSIKDARTALEVYQRGYIARLTEALGETFDAVWTVLGDEAFFRVCEDYIIQNGSKSYNLSDLGGSFPDHLAKTDHLNQLPFLVDLARFELLFTKVFHKKCILASSAPIDQNSINEKTKFFFHDELEFFFASHGVYEIWKNRKTPERTLPDEVWSNPEYLTVLRGQDGLIRIHDWSKWEFSVLQNFRLGTPLGEALEAGEVSEDALVGFFSKLFSSGVIAGVK